MLDHNLVMKAEELFLAGDISSDGSGERATGLYLRDTRHLDAFHVCLNGAKPATLSVRYHGARRAVVTMANRLLTLDNGQILAPQRILLLEEVEIGDDLRVGFRLENFTRTTWPMSLEMELGADFRDLFDIRGFSRAARGRLELPAIDGGVVRFSYTGRDDRQVETVVTFDGEPELNLIPLVPSQQEPVPVFPSLDRLSVDAGAAGERRLRAVYRVQLEPGQRWEATVTVVPKPVDSRPRVDITESEQGGCRIVTSDEALSDALDRASDDLLMLETRFDEGKLLAAGVPWFVAPFGRDSLIAGLQSLHLDPDFAIGALRLLSRLQGTNVDSFREEEPGKIPHEMRYGEMARLGEVPHSPYFGAIDATPLWIWLFAETVIWTGRRDLYQELLPHAVRAFAWIDEYGDADGDGLIEYTTERGGKVGIVHQVWKDSFDSLHDATGTPVRGLIAPVEAQGYHFAAADRLARLARAFDEPAFAEELEARAERVRRLVEERFWSDGDRNYAQALDAEKRPVGFEASNGGQLLLAGLPSAARAELMATRFGEEDFDSGWGVRTLASSAASYNPMSYHNGSVWPHDNSLIGAGFYRYRLPAMAESVVLALRDAAAANPLRRLPELYCGFQRSRDDLAGAPVSYPVSCSPQAWAAGALPLLIRAMLGLRVDPGERVVRLRPQLPGWIDCVELFGVRVLGHRGSLRVERVSREYRITGTGLPLEG